MLRIFAITGFTCNSLPEADDFAPQAAHAGLDQRLLDLIVPIAHVAHLLAGLGISSGKGRDLTGYNTAVLRCELFPSRNVQAIGFPVWSENGQKTSDKRVVMKNQGWALYFPAFLPLFLSLVLVTGPGFPDSSSGKSGSNSELAAASVIPADERPDCNLFAGKADVDSRQSEDFRDEDFRDNYDDLSESLSRLPFYHYPYGSLPSRLEAEGKESIRLFVYGSLMDCKSARRTLSEKTLKTRKLARAYGVKAIYNRSVPYIFTPHWGEPGNPCAIAMLNTMVTGNSEDIALGVLLDIPLDEIPTLLSREVGYDLKPVVVEDWVESPREETTSIPVVHDSGNLQIAYVLSSPTPGRYTAAHLLPREGYYWRVMEAARLNGPLFFQQWLNNTYLADGVTTVGYYELCKRKVIKKFEMQPCV